VQIRYDAPVDRLELRDGRFVAAHRCGRTHRGASCVLACGGFESNREWLREAWGQNERGEWPADNFLIRGTRFNQGVLLKFMIGAGADTIGDPTQAHCVAIDARAPLYDGGICTRVDCVSLGVMVNREAKRFYDEGEDFWPKRYAIWGRLVALAARADRLLHHRQKAIGRFMPPVFPARAGRYAAATRAQARPRRTTFMQTVTTTTPPAARHLRPHRAGRLPHRRPGAGQDALGAAIDTPPFYGYALRPGITFTYLG
jgi:tricarballylate dehydrogenase